MLSVELEEFCISSNEVQAEKLSNEQRVQIFLLTLSENLHSEWDLNLMARRCGLARSSFSEYCKKITKKPPTIYLTQLRVNKACSLLQKSKMSIKSIALQCGFHTNQYFSRQFKRFTGVSPSVYRDQFGN
jgi:AraC family L-rhamnose operon regulatory protein RhaS